MKMFDTILLSLAAGIFIIGIHQTMKWGLVYSYWIIMLSVAILLWYNLRKQKRKQDTQNK